MVAEEQLRQLARLLRLREPPASAAEARALAREQSEALADALFDEAAASDDVVGRDSARSYLELRLAHLSGLLDEETRQRVRERFERRLSNW